MDPIHNNHRIEDSREREESRGRYVGVALESGPILAENYHGDWWYFFWYIVSLPIKTGFGEEYGIGLIACSNRIFVT